MKGEVTYYSFYSNVCSFLGDLLVNPIHCDVSQELKELGISKHNLLQTLIKQGVVERHEKVKDMNKQGEKKPTYSVKYKINRNKFEDNMATIYKKLFNQQINECDCAGACGGGATSADACNATAPIMPMNGTAIQQKSPLRKISQKTVGKTKQPTPINILGTELKAESKEKAKKTVVISEKQYKKLQEAIR